MAYNNFNRMLTSAYNSPYQIEVSHSGLNKYRIVKGSTRWEAEQKANALRAQWNEQWKRKQEQMKKQEIRQQKIQVNEYGLKYAEEMTDEANDIQAKLDRILVDSLNSVQFDFDSLKDHTKFTAAKPKPPIYGQYPREPLRTDLIYNPKPPLLAKLSKSKLDAFNQENNNVFIKDHMKWEEEVRQIDISNNNLRGNYESAVNKWESDKKAFYDNQDENNRSIDEFEETVKNGDNQAIEGLFSLILNDIKYPFDYDKDVDVQYFPDEHQLIVEMFLPVQEDIPNKKAVTYVKSKQEIKESFYPEAYMKKKYDSVVYQIVMQTLNYCFNLSICDLSIESVVLNGRVRTIDKSTGNTIEPCILSVSSKKDDFCKLNLETIDPKAWFKSSKGVSAATLVNLTPVAPIVEMNKEDKRFIDSYEVADHLDEGDNIATMPWQDFENLIRELFEKEFNATGGEVKITQASRDGGVDAVAFDPDPIRGGKIVIQAKRYTNVVGVAAVRDLYGTVVNEGAIKGILVTTAHYGNDAYEFAKDKPLTLMNGANLLYLMEKHGYNVRIDINEAKKALKEKQ